MKNKQILVVDWDNTVIDTSKTIINLHNKLFENKIEYIEEHDWKFKPMINTDEELKELFKLFDNEHFYDEDVLVPIENSIEAIKLLSEVYKIVICSKHENSRRELTKNYIEKTFEGYDVSIEFVDNFEDKGELFKDKNVLAVIDDKIECFKGFDKWVIKILFGNYQWNKHCLIIGSSYRTDSWNMIIAIFVECDKRLFDYIAKMCLNKIK